MSFYYSNGQPQPYNAVPRRDELPYDQQTGNVYGEPDAYAQSMVHNMGPMPSYMAPTPVPPSQYVPSMPTASYPGIPPSNFRQVPSQASLISPQFYGYANNMPSGSVTPMRPASSAPVYRNMGLTPLMPVSDAMASSGSPYSGNEALQSSLTRPPMLQQPSPSISSAESPTSPASPSINRRHPAHPEGTPQPKGRGSRKSTKPDDLTKTLPCDGCDAMFARKHDLDRHRRIHTLEAPYICRGCKRSYRRSDARKRHWDQEPACSVLHARNSTEKALSP